MIPEVEEQMNALLSSASATRERKRLVYAFGEMLREVEAVVQGAETPARTAAKAAKFLEHLEDKFRDYPDERLLEGFMLNFTGEAIVRAEYLGKPVIEFVRCGLYFYGLSHIERFHRRQSMLWMSAHSELVMEFTGRKGLKALMARGQEKLAAERPFCLVNDYLNELKKRYWEALRQTGDACDHSMSLEAAEMNGSGNMALPESGAIDRDVESTTSEDRVQIMLRVFAERLTEVQQRVYLMRHPISNASNRKAMMSLDDQLAAFLAELDGDPKGVWGWKEIARRLEVSEKSAKKQYLRALHSLLSGACDEIFDGRLPSGMIRRLLTLLRTIVQERDLRIRDNAGLGLGKIVSRWEVALRFVLNHDRVVSGPGDDGIFVAETTL